MGSFEGDGEVPSDLRASLIPADIEWGALSAAERALWAGIVWSRSGRGDLAWSSWGRVDDPRLAAWRAAEQGRVLRELGLHADAEAVEAPALESAEDPVVAVMLRISLTADAVGRNAIDLAARRLAAAREASSRAEAASDSPRLARQRLRLAWVGAEVDWIHGRAPDGSGLPSRAVDGSIQWPADHAHGSDFHRTKSLLFAGMVHGDLDLLDRAIEIAPTGLAWAAHLARAALGAPDGERSAARAWSRCVPPPHVAAAVAATPTARRLRAVSGDS